MRGSAAFRAAVAPGGVLAGPWVRNELWRQARAVPSLDLRFAENKSLVDATTGSNLIDFTRASSGTYVGSDGLIKTATTNLLLRSEEFDDASWSGAGGAVATAGTSIAPNGTATADTLTDTNGTTASPFVFQTTTLADSTTYTMSCYLKAGTKTTARVGIRDKAGTVIVSNFDLSAGTTTVGNAASSLIQPVGNGWYRCIVVANSNTGATSQRGLVYLDTGSYTQDGTGTLLVWGAQLEQSTTVGEYVKTTSTINSAPRFDHNPTTGESLGLLVEESRTNLLLRSEEFDNAAWLTGASYSSISVDSEVAPDGSQTADVIDFASGSGFFYQTVTVSASTAYTFSFFRKVTGLTKVALYDASNAAWITQEATMTTTAYPNGWDKVWVSFTTPAGCTSLRVYPERLGGGVRSITFWGAQLEAGSFPTSYIPTTSSTVTRAADVTSISGSNFSSWYSNTAGTMYSDWIAVVNGARSFHCEDAGRTNAERFAQRTASNFVQAEVASNGVLVVDSANAAGTISAYPVKIRSCSAYDTENCVVAYKGIAESTATANGAPECGEIFIGSYRGIATQPNAPIARLTYWPQRLSDSTLQALTR